MIIFFDRLLAFPPSLFFGNRHELRTPERCDETIGKQPSSICSVEQIRNKTNEINTKLYIHTKKADFFKSCVVFSLGLSERDNTTGNFI
jgi:hypothetical protein